MSEVARLKRDFVRGELSLWEFESLLGDLFARVGPWGDEGLIEAQRRDYATTLRRMYPKHGYAVFYGPPHS